MIKPTIVLMLGIFACSPSKDPRDTVVITQSDIDSTLVSSHTTTILGEEYRGFGTSEQKLFVLNSKGDTVVSQSDMYFDFEFRDFDGDSLKDIVVHELSNTPSVQDLLLFDRAKMTFTMVKGFNNFPDPNPLEGQAIITRIIAVVVPTIFGTVTYFTSPISRHNG